MDSGILLAIIFAGVLGMFVYSMNAHKNQMLCAFIRPNKQRIEKWVPLYSKYIIWDRGKYGIGRYDVDPECIVMQWYDRGINKLFPMLVPYAEYKWDTPRPLDPRTGKSTWLTPETAAAAFQEHNYVAFEKGTQTQIGKKDRFPSWFFPVITLGVLLIIMFMVYSQGNRIDGLEEIIANIR